MNEKKMKRKVREEEKVILMQRECKLTIFLELWMLGMKEMKKLQVNFLVDYFFLCCVYVSRGKASLENFLLD